MRVEKKVKTEAIMKHRVRMAATKLHTEDLAHIALYDSLKKRYRHIKDVIKTIIYNGCNLTVAMDSTRVLTRLTIERVSAQLQSRSGRSYLTRGCWSLCTFSSNCSFR